MKFNSLNETTKSLGEQVADQMIQLIQENSLKEGQKLPNEFELAEQLGVGRGTVREAVKLLAARNILEIRRGKGTFVSEHPGQTDDPLGLSFVQNKDKLVLDLFEARMMVEPEIVAMAAQTATKEDVLNMHRLCDEIEAMAAKGENYLELDLKLHTSFARSTRNHVVMNISPAIVRGVITNVERTNLAFWKETMRDHREIVKAIEGHDSDKARAEMIRHLVSTNQDEIEDVYICKEYRAVIAEQNGSGQNS